MADLKAIENALRKADAAGDVDGARTLAAEYRRLSIGDAAASAAAVSQPSATDGQASQPDKNWSDLPGNILPSAGRMAEGIYQAVRHPVNTVSTVGDAVMGGIDRIPKPDWLLEAQKSLPWAQSQETVDRRRMVSGQLGQLFKDRYGGLQNIKETAINDPVGIAADVAGLLTGAGAAVSSGAKLGAAGNAARVIGKAGSALTKAGDVINPISAVVKVAKYPAVATGKAIAHGLSIPTGVSGESIIEAARSGYRGGSYGEAFRDNMRGNVPQSAVVENAKTAIDNMAAKRSAEYVAGMAATKANKIPVNYNRIENAMGDLVDSMFHGNAQTANAETLSLTKKVGEVINEWQKEFPNPTAYDLDRLKIRIDGLKPNFTNMAPGQERVITTVRNAVKDEILSADPGYAKTMKAYEQSRAVQNEIERSLSLGGKSTSDSALRKLQSITRNNANTNYGARVNSAKVLESSGAGTLLSELAGQQLNAVIPRGLARYVSPTVGGAAIASPGLSALALPALLASSPRLVGEVAHAGGRIARVASRSGRRGSSLAALASGKTGDTVNQLYKDMRP